MRITNGFDLPEPYWRACAKQRTYTPGRVSVTELLTPPQMRFLRRQHDHELTEDCADLIDAFFGTAVHAYLEQFGGVDAEQTIEWTDEASGWVVHGTPDLLDSGELIDWKTTRVRALQYDREEWAQQTNLYAELLRLNGREVREIVVWAFCKDYDPQKRNEDGYPRAAVVKIPMPLWHPTTAHEFLMRRLRLHEAGERGMYGPCTDDERWKRDTWAVYGKGQNGRAKHVASSEEAAMAYVYAATDEPRQWRDWFEVQKRDGDPLRCMDWCVARSVCPQWAQEKPQTLLEQLEGSVRKLEAKA